MSDVSPALQEPWPDLAVLRTGVSVGIWAFLASEILFFSGLFITYAVYRASNMQAFQWPRRRRSCSMERSIPRSCSPAA